MNIQKKAMSPMLSTIILIGFAVALGGVVMSWGKAGYMVEKPDRTCRQTSLALISYGANKGICSKENRLYFTIQNNGEINLGGIKVDILGDKNIYSTFINKRINIADIAKLNLVYPNIGKIEKVIFVPEFTYLAKEKLCPKNGFSVERVGEC